MENPITRDELLKKIEKHENVSTVNTSLIDDMSGLFYVDYYFNIIRGKDFNQPLNNWDVSNVTNMTAMFWGALSFNQSLNDWDVSKVEKMAGMFYGAISFNQPLNDWDVSKVKEMNGMFHGAESFNQPLNDWDVSKVEKMSCMFCNAKKFNQPLNNWDVSKVENMNYMFSGAKNYTYSFKTWKLKSHCDLEDFLDDCHLWHLVNTVEDLPMMDNERIEIEDNKIWKVL